MPFRDHSPAESERIAEGLRRGDMKLIAELVERHHYRLVRYLRYVTGRRDRADDLAQETWLRVLARGRQYDRKSRFDAWLLSIAHNLAVDGSRKWRREDAVPEAADATAPDASSPFLAAARGEDCSRLAAALGRLDPAYREAILLRFQEDLSLPEIACILQAPVSTVSSRIYHGLAQLRTLWKGDNHAE